MANRAIQRRLFATAATSQNDFAHCIIGGGVIGLAIAAKLGTRSHAPTVLLERHSEVGTETSSRNSEVIHAGIYYPKDSLKSALCIRGKNLMYELCEKYSIPYKNLGKWIVGQSDEDAKTLEGIYSNCKDLGVPLNWVSQKEAKELEPDVHAPSGILNSPTTGIVSSHDLMTYLRGQFEDASGDISVQTTVTSISRLSSSGGYEITSRTAETSEELTITADVVINAAGLGAGAISNMLLPQDRHIKSYYCKGNYFSYASGKPKVRRLIYPCPVTGLAGLGTHVTLDMAGKMKFGPDVEWVDDPNDLTPDGRSLDQAAENILKFLPGVDISLLTPDYCGIRPKLAPKGSGFQDFVIREEDGFPGFINLLGIESPGLTSSLAIAEKVEDILYK